MVQGLGLPSCLSACPARKEYPALLGLNDLSLGSTTLGIRQYGIKLSKPTQLLEGWVQRVPCISIGPLGTEASGTITPNPLNPKLKPIKALSFKPTAQGRGPGNPSVFARPGSCRKRCDTRIPAKITGLVKEEVCQARQLTKYEFDPV